MYLFYCYFNKFPLIFCLFSLLFSHLMLHLFLLLPVISSPLIVFAFLNLFWLLTYLCFHSFASINAYKTHNCPHIVPVCLFCLILLLLHVFSFFCLLFFDNISPVLLFSLCMRFSVYVCVCLVFRSKGFGLCVRVLFL